MLQRKPRDCTGKQDPSQKLATDALARASPTRLQFTAVCTFCWGTFIVSESIFPDAEQEYRKALALNAEDAGALFGLSLTLLADSDWMRRCV